MSIVQPETFTWLHLTDLHVGITNQNWLWPSVKQALLDDLRKLSVRIGAIDLVIFSGDLTQGGTIEQFLELDKVFNEIWSFFAELGMKPQLFVVPGNHDVQRPSKLSPELLVLKSWWSFPIIHEEFFTDLLNPYKKTVDGLFVNYVDWLERTRSSNIPVANSTHGWLPGDQSITLKKGALSVGVIGLNSTWLQIDGDDYRSKLHVDARQLLRVTNDDPAKWCSGNDLNLLVSHHPLDWLHPDCREFWNAEIYIPERFLAHFYGHMHDPSLISISSGGSKARHSFQGASLFGLMKTPNGLDRTHGYSVGQLLRTSRSSKLKFGREFCSVETAGSEHSLETSDSISMKMMAPLFYAK
jgi:predicted MPP superfamily phosphohydrolase